MPTLEGPREQVRMAGRARLVFQCRQRGTVADDPVVGERVRRHDRASTAAQTSAITRSSERSASTTTKRSGSCRARVSNASATTDRSEPPSDPMRSPLSCRANPVRGVTVRRTTKYGHVPARPGWFTRRTRSIPSLRPAPWYAREEYTERSLSTQASRASRRADHLGHQLRPIGCEHQHFRPRGDRGTVEQNPAERLANRGTARLPHAYHLLADGLETPTERSLDAGLSSPVDTFQRDVPLHLRQPSLPAVPVNRRKGCCGVCPLSNQGYVTYP